MKKRMMAAVPKASVVITNPTHYAVALQYERGMSAPVCVAKGVDAAGAQDPRSGRRSTISRWSKTRRWRGRLHATVEIDEEIPPEHYKAVAEIIGYVMKLQARAVRPDGWICGVGRLTGQSAQVNCRAMRHECSRLMDLRWRPDSGTQERAGGQARFIPVDRPHLPSHDRRY